VTANIFGASISEKDHATKPYHQVFSTDAGRSWSHAAVVNGTGCVKPRMMMLGAPDAPGPLLLTGGRGRRCHSTLPLTAIGRHSVWNCKAILRSSLPFLAKVTVSPLGCSLAGGETVIK
jgi:hypothetical protein